MRICVADDEKEVRESIILKLKMMDPEAEIYDAGFGNRALHNILLVKPDLVLLDILMPEIDGLDILQAISRQLPRTTVAMLSGYSEFEHARKAIQLGAVDYLLKPADREQIRSVIDKVKHNMNRDFLVELRPHLAALASHFIYVEDIKGENLSAWFDDRQWKGISFDEPEPDARGTAVFSFQVNRADRGYVTICGTPQERFGFHERNQFLAAFQSSFELYESRRFWGGEDQPVRPDTKRTTRLRNEIASMGRQSGGAKYAELEHTFAEWLACIRRFGLKPLRKEVVALMALLDEGMSDQHEWVVPDEDKLRYWMEWVHPFRTWDELCATLTKYVVQGIRALTQLKTQPTNSNWVEQAIKVVHSSNMATVSLDYVAAEVGVHPVTLSRMFKKRMGINFVQFLIKRRLELAQSLLLQTGKPVSEVAEEVGYLDYRYFRAQFKKEFGVTPGEYRAQNGIAAPEESE